MLSYYTLKDCNILTYACQNLQNSINFNYKLIEPIYIYQLVYYNA